MAASASNTTTRQHPIWIQEDNIYCNEVKLLDHLTRNPNYNENDAASIIQQINGHIKIYGLRYFWNSAGETMSTEAIRVLLHSIEHSQLSRLIIGQNIWYQYTALHYSADNKGNEVIKVILGSVSEEEGYWLLSITAYVRQTQLHMPCYGGDTESVAVMLNHVNQDMRYSLVQMTSDFSDTPLNIALGLCHTGIMKVIN